MEFVGGGRGQRGDLRAMQVSRVLALLDHQRHARRRGAIEARIRLSSRLEGLIDRLQLSIRKFHTQLLLYVCLRCRSRLTV